MQMTRIFTHYSSTINIGRSSHTNSPLFTHTHKHLLRDNMLDSGIIVSDQSKEEFPVVSGRIPSNSMLQSDAVTSMILFFDPLHVDLSLSDDHSRESILICAEPFDSLAKGFLVILLGSGQALYRRSEEGEELILWISFQILQKFISLKIEELNPCFGIRLTCLP